MRHSLIGRLAFIAVSIFFSVSSLAGSCPSPAPGNGPEFIQYCENYADQRASRNNFSTWNYFYNYCINSYGHCVGGGSSGSSSGGGSTGGSPSQCAAYANAFLRPESTECLLGGALQSLYGLINRLLHSKYLLGKDCRLLKRN